MTASTAVEGGQTVDDPLVETLAQTLYGLDGRWLPWAANQPGVREQYREDARKVLATIAESGRLLSSHWADAEIRVEWGNQSVWPDFEERQIWPARDEAEARAAVAMPPTGDMLGRRALCRTIHTGPWQVAS